MLKQIRKRIIAFVLIVALMTGMIPVGNYNVQKADAFGVGTAFEVFNVAIKTSTTVFNLTNDLAGMGKATTEEKFNYVIDSIFGTNLSGKPTVDEQLAEIYKTVGNVEDKVSAIDGKVNEINSGMRAINSKLAMLDTISSKLDKQNETLAIVSDNVTQLMESAEENHLSTVNQINGMSDRVEALMKDQTEELKVSIFDSTIEMKNATTLLSALNTYYDSFDGLASVEETILQDLAKRQESYTAFIEAIQELENGKEILEVLNKITMNYEESYAALSEEEKTILDTEVTLEDSGKIKANKYLKDYMDFMHTYMTETIYSKSSGYTSNIYDTVKLMGEYITGNVSATGNTGVGEIFYKMNMLDKSTNREVHAAYNNFMSGVLQDYFITAYLCELSLAYQIAYDTCNGGNSVEISTNKEHLQNVYEQMERVQAYTTYELKKCIKKYDFSEYKDGEYEKSLVYYGNSTNAKNGINGWKCVDMASVYVAPTMSADSMQLAVAEERPLKFYQGVAERTNVATWTSSDESVAVVNADGTVTAVSQGNAVITAEFDSYSATCQVIVGNGYAKANGTETSNYYYGAKKYSVQAAQGYDYYYNVDSYGGNTIALTDKKQSAGLVEATGLTENELELYTWISSAPEVAEYSNGQIVLTDDGSCVISGYRYVEEEDRYECMGIPVIVTVDTSADMESDAEMALKDYEDYIKISTKEDLIALSRNPEGWGSEYKYVLTNDIDLGGMEWEPIGYQFTLGTNTASSLLASHGYVYRGVPFSGVFEGNGHEIKNFKITQIPHANEMIAAMEESYEEYNTGKYYQVRNDVGLISVGFFGYTVGADIQNLNISGAEIQLETGVDAGKSFTLGGNPYDFYMASDAKTYAGGLAGNASSPSAENITKVFETSNSEELEGKSEEEQAALIEEGLAPYTREMPEDIKELGGTNIAYIQYAVLEAIRQDDERNTKVNNCSVDGNLKIEGGTPYVGMLYGAINREIENSYATGTITINATDGEGAVGGLIGHWRPCLSAGIYNSVSEVEIKVSGQCVAGGLIGKMEKLLSVDFRGLAISAEEVTSPKCEAENCTHETCGGEAYARAETKFQSVVTLIFLPLILGGDEQIMEMVMTDKLGNNRIDNCQVLGNISGGDTVGGLIGQKWIEGEDLVFKGADTDEAKGEVAQTNLDIFECYVDADITTTGDYAGGLIGTVMRETVEADVEEADKGTIYTGTIDNCYVHGSVQAGSIAAGLIATREVVNEEVEEDVYEDVAKPDKLSITDVVVTCETITADGKDDTEVYPVCKPGLSSESVDYSRIYYYDNMEYTRKTSGSTNYTATSESEQGTDMTATQLNNSENYIKLWGDSFCNLSDLDFKDGIIPTVLPERYFMNLEKAKKHYHVGDDFEPVTQILVYDGLGSEYVTEGVSSTTPDMSKPGVRKVEVSYGRYTESYEVYIYPIEEAYIKVLEKPESTYDGEEITLSGGKIGVYNSDNTLSREVSIDDCEKEYCEGYVILVYDNMSTSLKTVSVEVYSNTIVGEQGVELINEFKYLEGDTVDSEMVVEETRKVTYKDQNISSDLITSTLKEDTVINADMCVVAMYEEYVEQGTNPTASPEPVNPTASPEPVHPTVSPEPVNPTASPDLMNPTTGNNSTKPTLLKVGTQATSDDGKAIYKVTTSDLTNGTVTYMAPADSNAATVTIPDAVVIGGVTYKVTAIEKNAFKNAKLKKIIIGKNVTKIGAKAFYGCKNLKKVIIKSTKLKLKNVGKKAFAKTSKKMTVKVPKKQFKAYKKMLIKRGVNKKVKFKK